MKRWVPLAMLTLTTGCGPVRFGIAEYRSAYNVPATATPGSNAPEAQAPLLPREEAGGGPPTAIKPLAGPRLVGPATTASPATPVVPEATAGPTIAPASVPQSQQGDDVVGVRLVSEGSSGGGARASFGEAFPQGRLPAGSGLAARVNGRDVPAQLDVKTSYPDGSVHTAIVTVDASGGAEVILIRRPTL